MLSDPCFVSMGYRLVLFLQQLHPKLRYSCPYGPEIGFVLGLSMVLHLRPTLISSYSNLRPFTVDHRSPTSYFKPFLNHLYFLIKISCPFFSLYSKYEFFNQFHCTILTLRVQSLWSYMYLQRFPFSKVVIKFYTC